MCVCLCASVRACLSQGQAGLPGIDGPKGERGLQGVPGFPGKYIQCNISMYIDMFFISENENIKHTNFEYLP